MFPELHFRVHTQEVENTHHIPWKQNKTLHMALCWIGKNQK